MFDLTPLNALPEAEARASLLRCCGATRWAENMSARRPFADAQDLFDAAHDIAKTLSRTDWLEAFAAHPKIGDLDSLRNKFAHTAAWSAQEQGSLSKAAEATLRALAAGNQAYESKFGHIFIVCATGKSVDDMLALLERRLGNSPADELRIAAAEQEKITRLRLQRLLQNP
jgi:2-oxo-4-hydroxy-4-carboxy-5-ureidoimidazoline decarboxylase